MPDPELGRLPNHDVAAAPDTVHEQKIKHPSNWRSRISFANAPTLRDYLRIEWLDLLFLFFILLIPILMFVFVPPLTRKYFLLEQNGMTMAPQYAYPHGREYINTFVSAALSFAVPFLVMSLVSLFLIGDFWDINSAIMGLSFALCVGDLFQILVKWVIGGLRPHFYSVCQPVIPTTTNSGIGHRQLYYDRSVCTGNTRGINLALMSFPSGHAVAAFAGFIFLALWINAKFKVCADFKARIWQLILLATPILFAVLLALSKIIDYYHHWYDVLAGALIGTLMAFLSYRMCYAAVFDWRYNHIPLPYSYAGDRIASTHTQIVESTRTLTAINMAGWKNKRTKPINHPVAGPKAAQLDGAVTTSVSSAVPSIAQMDGCLEPKFKLEVKRVFQSDEPEGRNKFKLKMRRLDVAHF